jgi:hypothetical protein
MKELHDLKHYSNMAVEVQLPFFFFVDRGNQYNDLLDDL